MSILQHSHKHEHGGEDPQCLEIFARLSEYLDGDLPAGDCAEVEAHIADCPPCVEFLKGLRGSIEASHSFKTPATPDPVDAQMRERLQRAWTDALARRRGPGPAA